MNNNNKSSTASFKSTSSSASSRVSMNNNTKSSVASFKTASSAVPGRGGVRRTFANWVRAKRNLVRKVNSSDIIEVNLPLPEIEKMHIKKVFDFASRQMAKALSNLMEAENAAKRTGAAKYQSILTRYIRAVGKINGAIDIQATQWAAALKDKTRHTVKLSNYPVTPLSGYAMSNRLRYQKNITMMTLSPKVRAMLDDIGQRFAVIRNELKTNTTRQFLREISMATTQNALKRLENKAWSNGINKTAINTAVSKRRAELTTPPIRRFRYMKTVRSLLPSRFSLTMA